MTSSLLSGILTYDKTTPTHPLVHRETIHDVDVLWTGPNNDDDVSGILFVAHGCHHSNTDWFINCDGCIGLPEERGIINIAFDLGLLVIVFSSMNRRSKCWSTTDDIEPLARVLKEFSDRFLKKEAILPIYAFGVSSGGYFVSAIATKLEKRFQIHLNGYVSQISAKTSDPAAECKVYITMDRDVRTDVAAKNLVEECKDQTTNSISTGTAVSKKIKCKHIPLRPLSVTPSYFANRIPEISVVESEQLVRALQDAGFIDKGSDELIEDPRHSNWRAIISQYSQRYSLIADESPISEIMNVAWGKHELTRDGVEEALKFCMQNVTT
ncbi:MAG: hypothetical protein ACI8RD_006146 [Bacillariaceae sp.]|jgi:hypothetical protein